MAHLALGRGTSVKEADLKRSGEKIRGGRMEFDLKGWCDAGVWAKRQRNVASEIARPYTNNVHVRSDCQIEYFQKIPS